MSESWTIDGDPDSLPVLVGPQPTHPAENPGPNPDSQSPPKESPPSPNKIAEAMLFAGGLPLTPEKFSTAIRSPGDLLHAIVADLNRAYRRQNRPYVIQPRDGGYILMVKPAYRSMREKLYGGPREARISQPALDVLSIVAYRQPVDREEIDTIRGVGSGTVIRQLVRLGLLTIVRRGETGEPDVKYGTTNRFLEIFGLGSLDDLPRLGEAQQL